MFAYCNNNSVNNADKQGTNPDAATAWASTMWWLCGVDTVLPIGDALYAGGFAVLLLFTSSTNTSSTADIHQSKTTLIASITSAAQMGAGMYAAKKPVNLPSWKKLEVDMDHISSGHLPGGPRNPNGKKTIFVGMTLEQVYRAIQEAYNNSSKLMTQGERILLQGYSGTFNLIIEIWVNIAEKIIETAYPVGR